MERSKKSDEGNRFASRIFESICEFLRLRQEGESQCCERRRGNALEAILCFGMKQMLKAVVEVQYTTGTLEVAG